MKLSIFILEVVAFIIVSLKIYHTEHQDTSQWFSEINNFFRLGLILLALILLFFIIRMITQSGRYFTYIFIGMISLPITYELNNFITRQKEININQNKEAWKDQADKKYEEIWHNINNPEKALQLIDMIELLPVDRVLAQNNINLHKTALYLSLGLHNDNYYQTFVKRFKKLETIYEIQRVAYYALVYYQPKSDKEYRKIINAFARNKNAMIVVGRFFIFEDLVIKGFEESALLMLQEMDEIEDKENYFKVANQISNITIRKSALDYIAMH